MGYAIKRYHGSYNISPRAEAVRYIVVHYVGSGTSAPGSARANCQFFAGGNRNSSAHYFLDDAYIYEYADPARYATWHCGDGRGRYGITNANSIGIEVCINGDVPYTAAEEERLDWLVGELMERFGVPAERVVRHYDASRKACPYYYTPYGSGRDAAWAELHDRIVSGDSTEEASEEEGEGMTEIIINVPKSDDMATNIMVYVCGDRVHDIADPEALRYLQQVYREAHGGREIPMMELSGARSKPEFQRFLQAIRGGVPSAEIFPAVDMLAGRSEERADGNDGTE